MTIKPRTGDKIGAALHLPQILYYNETYKENICDRAKTRDHILEWYRHHDNINILVERGEKKYVQTGRLQNEQDALAIDRALRELLERENLPFVSMAPDLAVINAFARGLN